MTREPIEEKYLTGLFSSLKKVGVDITPENHPSDDMIQRSIVGKEWVNERLIGLAKHNNLSAKHSIRVARIAVGVLNLLSSYSEEDGYLLARAALLHDIGKTDVDNNILESSRKLSPDEKTVIMEKHVRVAFETLRENDPRLAKIVVGHHEHQDYPYPRQVPREGDKEIVKLQRLLALCDAVDSMMSNRSYDKPRSPQEVIRELHKQFDPNLVKKAVEIRQSMNTY